MSPTEPIVKVQNLSFGYSNNLQTLSNLTFNIEPNEFVGLIGPNGSGKTTLIKLILGFINFQNPKATTKIQILGQNQPKFNQWNKIGYVFQSPTHDQNFPLSVKEILEISILKNNQSNGLDYVIDKTLSFLKIANLKHKPMTSLSGGQKQKVYIATAIINKPILLFLDEPTTGIDYFSEAEFFIMLEQMKRNLKTSIVMVSHDIGVVSQKVDRIFCLNKTLTIIDQPKSILHHNQINALYQNQENNILIHNHSH